MTVSGAIAVVVTVLITGAVFYFGFKKTGPWGSFWSFLLIIFLGTLLASIWVTPIGPVNYGAAWLDLFVIAILLALLLVAASPTTYEKRKEAFKQSDVIDDKTNSNSRSAAIGAFFWVLITVFVILIGIGII